MSETRTLILGFIAGATILLGLPPGRLRRPMPAVSQFLNATAVGILIFLVWDVLAHAWEPLDAALGRVHEHSGGLGPVFGYGALFLGGLSVGLLGLLGYERALARRSHRPQQVDAAGRPPRFAPGAMAADELTSRRSPVESDHSPARRLAMTIAVGIGLHNFGEGWPSVAAPAGVRSPWPPSS
jgi:ZIP family zinc transporter